MEAQMLEERREGGREGGGEEEEMWVCMYIQGRKEKRIEGTHPHRIHEGKEQRRQQNQIRKR
jgi:hypothetical protein